MPELKRFSRCRCVTALVCLAHLRLSPTSELIPHRKLRRPRSDRRIHRPPQPRREKHMDRDAEMRPIEEIENFGAKFQLMPFGETEDLVDSQIGVDYA